MEKPGILIVEDERIIAEDMKEMLSNFGYDVCGLSFSGESAVKMAGESHPCLILMDIFLAGEMSGIEAAEKIQQQYGIPVIFLTSFANRHIIEKAKVAEPYGYILKPFDERELHSAIEIALYKYGRDRLLKETFECLKRANAKLNLLSGITRHDILNQLTLLQGYLELFGSGQLDERQKQYLDRARMAAKTIQRQITFTREYGEIGVKSPEWQDLRTLISRSNEHDGRIPVSVDINDVEIWADPLVRTVFANLFDNAQRHATGITVLRFTTYLSGDALTIVCEDNGPGISEEEKSKIFERGYGKNTGLGLFLSREILEITGLTIDETGEPGKGARFEITVPDQSFRFKSTE